MTLRIDMALGADPPTLVLSGRLSLAEVAELERTAAAAGLPLRIDLGHLVNADAEGRRSLCRQKGRGVCLVGASPYIEPLLQSAEGPEREPEK